MEAVVTEVPIKKIKIDGNDIYLENFEKGKGKITITTPNGLSYSYFYGAMGSDLETFIQDIDSDYFAKNLIPHDKKFEMNVKSTFSNLRKYIREEIGLKWFQDMEFQKQMREVLNDFQKKCEENPDSNYFVLAFDSSFTNELNLSLIKDHWNKKYFESFNEVWYFISEKYTTEYKNLRKLHKNLVKQLKKKQK